MPQPIPYEDNYNKKQIPICQKCFERTATKICGKCGIQLCNLCFKTHGCYQRKKERIVN